MCIRDSVSTLAIDSSDRLDTLFHDDDGKSFDYIERASSLDLDDRFQQETSLELDPADETLTRNQGPPSPFISPVRDRTMAEDVEENIAIPSTPGTSRSRQLPSRSYGELAGLWRLYLPVQALDQ